MNVMELVASARERNENAFKDVTDQRSAKIVTEALRDLIRRLEETDAERFDVDGVGTFMVKEGAKGGKRIVLRPAPKGDAEARPRGKRARQGKKERAAD